MSLVSARAGNARRFSMIGCTNSTATCSASQELPPLPMTNNWCPAASASASRLQTSSSTLGVRLEELLLHLGALAALAQDRFLELRRRYRGRRHALRLRFDRDQMPPVVVVGGARAFGRDHRRAQRRLRRALRAERRAVVRLLQPLQHLPADADRRLLRAGCSRPRRCARRRDRGTRSSACSRSWG